MNMNLSVGFKKKLQHHTLVRENVRSAAERRKVKYGAFLRGGVKFQPGQLVYYFLP